MRSAAHDYRDHYDDDGCVCSGDIHDRTRREVFYREFGLTMAMSIILSGIVALTLTPVLCAMILKPHSGHEQQTGLVRFLNQAMSKLAGDRAFFIASLLCICLGLTVGLVVDFLLPIEIVHEMVSEQFPLTETRVQIVAGIVALVAALTFRATFSGSEKGKKET